MPNEKDMLIETYRIQVERWNKRRDIEWRVALTFWSAIVIITLGIAGKIHSPCVIAVIYGIVFFSIGIGFDVYGYVTQRIKSGCTIIKRKSTRNCSFVTN